MNNNYHIVPINNQPGPIASLPFESDFDAFSSYDLSEDVELTDLTAIDLIENPAGGKQADENLKESEARLRDLFENAHDIIYIHDLAGNYISINRAAERIFGYTSEEIRSMNIGAIVVPEDLEKIRERISERAAGNLKPTVYEIDCNTKDGRRLTLEVGSRVILKDGVPAAIQGIARDVTERKHAEKTLKRSEEQYRSLYENANRDLTERNRAEAESEAITAIIKGVTTTSDMDELLELVHQCLKNVIYAENCYVALHDKKTDLLHIPFCKDQFDTAAPPQKLGRGLTAYVLRRGEAKLMSPEVIRQLNEQGEIELIGTPPAIWLGVPLRTLSGIIGVLVVQHYEDRNAYGQRDLELLTAVGDQIALAIERKRTEEALRENEAKFRDLFDNAPVAYHEIDTNGCFTRINHTEELLLGYTDEELRGRHVWEIVVEKDLREDVAEKLGGQSQFRPIERTFIRKDGTFVSVLKEDRLIFDSDENITGIRSTLQDITQRKLDEEQLRISGMQLAEANKRAIREYDYLLNRLATLAQATGAARDLPTVFSAILNFARESVPCSALLISLFDQTQTSRQVIFMWYNGKESNVTDIGPVKVAKGPVGQALETGEVIIVDDYQGSIGGKTSNVYFGYDEDSRNPRSTVVALMKIMGNAIGVIEVQSYDLEAYTQEHATAMRMAANLAANAIENVRLLEQERRGAEQLRESQKLESVGRLAGGIAHDFNNMLTAINGYSDLTLRKLPEGDALRQNLLEIKKAGERSAALTQQLLAFSRRQVLKPKVLDINQEVTEIGKLLERLIGEDIKLVANLGADIGRVEADPGQLSQVIINLAVNSRDAMPQGGKLVIETSNFQIDAEYAARHIGSLPGDYVRISVTDTGSGMSQEIQEHVFEPFYTTKEVGKGTGLGLATVYGIVNQSGGYIRVESEVGKGTTFEVFLPRIEEEIKAPKVSVASDQVPNGTETILLVEDEEIVRNLTRQILETCGYSVIEASDGVQALAVCKQQDIKFDLLITDVVMPNMSGRQLAEELAALRPDAKVLYMSGYTDDAVIRQGVIEIDKNFIQKPFTFDAFSKKVREMLDARI